MINNTENDNKISTQSNVVIVIGMAAVLATLLIPLPTIILDTLLACSISLALAVLIVTLSSKEALELSSFPSLLLFVTLFRLSLNVASTRLILLNADAGKIIETFGSMVAGNSFVVGIVIFLILVIIQFIVITKGAERISEVSARFTLDAMPGKQMAIDADLNAGTITEEQANERRSKIVKESEFYGAMDGASKFIRGDAKAGLIITAINIVGGIVMGYSKGMTVANAVKTFTILSIGDGLVSQIPSLIISISSGFLVTKISSSNNVGHDLAKQFLKTPQTILMIAIIVTSLAFVPGLPAIPFLLLGGASFITANAVKKSQKSKNQKSKKSSDPSSPEKEPIENFLNIDRISVHVGVRLVQMVDPRNKSTIFERIGALRRRFAKELGVIIPLVRLKDNIHLEPTTYEIRFSDLPVATGKIEPKMFLAMDSGAVIETVDGIKTTEPVYGLPALWVTDEIREKAELNGYTVIDPESVFITHLSETIKKHTDEMLTREDVQALVDRLRQSQPSLVGEVVGELVPIGLLQRVMKNLLINQIPIKELTVILEALSENAAKTKNPTTLTELVRKSLKRTITEIYKDESNKITVIALDPVFEHHLISTLKPNGDEFHLALNAQTAIDLNTKIAQAWKNIMNQGKEKVVLVCDSRIRSSLAAMFRRSLPLLPVIAYDEIIMGTHVEPFTTIKCETTQNPELEENNIKELQTA
jgi:flagellar biosynthesis protein FlhA